MSSEVSLRRSLAESAGSAAAGIEVVLVVDDSAAQRRLLRKVLERMGHRVVEAASGSEALDIADRTPVDLVLSDWVMPGMDGLQFCQAFRAIEREDYGYFILLTSKSSREDMRVGFEAGADDFLSKPVDSAELQARINAGDRIVRMQRDLARKNGQLAHMIDELQTLYAAFDRDLDEARALQQSLVPERQFRFDGADVTLLLRPAGKVGGDLVGAYPIAPGRVGLYSIDVSGHGIASALMTARIAGLFTGPTPERNLLLVKGPGDSVEMADPEAVCHDLNAHLIEEMDTEHYVTAMIADCDLENGVVRIAQAGHPPAIVMGGDGTTRLEGEGGMPIGLLDTPSFSRFDLHLRPADRLFFFSDGLTECPGSGGGFLGDEGLSDLLTASRALRGEDFFEALMWDVEQYAGTTGFDDDVSGVVLEFRPSG
ncbi:MAG: SpoIIE family protein phosphatase [Pseudomonadota bacterium]